MKIRKYKRLIYRLLGLILTVVILLMIFLSLVPLPNDADWNYSTVILDEDGDYLRVYLDDNDQWHLKYQGQIPSKLQTAILQFEDKYYFHHPGVNPVSIIRALYSNFKAGRVVSGGSTITMQVARLYSKRERTLTNKIYEALITLKLELFYTKDEIFLIYLNNASYGSNIVGIKSASYKYFGKELEHLTWAEATLFAVLPNNPGYLFPGRNTRRLREKRDLLLYKLMKEDFIDEEQYNNSLREPIPTKVKSFPIIAAHLSDRLKNQSKSVHKTTISKKLQLQIENIAESQGAYLSSLGIKNLAILISNNKTHEVKAYVGSNAYLSASTNGFVDGVQALRSSGSILKPFIYGYALEKGVITPNSLLEDVNKNYGILLPKNYDKQYRGLATVTEALQKSLNIPAYEVTQMIGVNEAVTVLKSVGMKSLTRGASDYGLSICIGGAEANLWDLNEMYQTLANYGDYSSLKLTSDQKSKSKVSLLSPATCYLLLEILQGVKRPQHFINEFPNYAWKTGTSNGFRDAWALAVSPDWTISVWAGNFTGEGNPNLTGKEIAGNILFKVTEILPDNDSFFQKPWADFKQVPVCAVSGYSPTKDCIDTLWIDLPKTAFILPKCSYHKQIIVDTLETIQLCSACWQERERKAISVLDYPPNVDYYLKQAGFEVPQLPKHNPDCSRINSKSDLIIKYPLNNSNIYLPIDLSGNINSFQAEAYTSDDAIYWFLDDLFLGQTNAPHKIDIVTNTGDKKLLVISSEGVSKTVFFKILKKED